MTDQMAPGPFAMREVTRDVVATERLMVIAFGTETIVQQASGLCTGLHDLVKASLQVHI